MWYRVVIAALGSYLLGNLNGAVIVSRVMAHEDVRSHGSGNAGLTNFIRNYGVRTATLVVLIDVGKAVAACLLGQALLSPLGYAKEGQMLGAACVLLGHIFPALLGFKGGKGILSGFTIALMVDWRIGLLIFLTFAVAYGLTQYVSLGSVLAAAMFGVGFILFYRQQPMMMWTALLLAALVIFMHRGNIQRLLRGEERKTNLFGKGRKQ